MIDQETPRSSCRWASGPKGILCNRSPKAGTWSVFDSAFSHQQESGLLKQHMKRNE